MTPADRDPFGALSRLDHEFDALVREGFGRGTAPTPLGFVPSVEIRADAEDVVISLELPGVDADEDVALEITGGQLVISGRRRAPGEAVAADDSRLILRELRYGAFRRSFDLPEGVGASKIQANYERGMLMVRVRGAAQHHTNDGRP